MTNLSGANLNNGAAVGPQGEGRESPSSFPAYPAYKDSGVEWAGVLPAEWKILKLKRAALLQSGEFITSEAIEEDSQYPVYGGNGLRGYTVAYTHDGEFALIGRQGALCGNINYAEGKFWASEHAVVVYPEKGIVTRWLGELLRSMNLGQYSVSAAQPGLSVERIADLFIPVPSPIEQSQIACFLDHETARIDALIEEQQCLIELLKEKRQAVISHAVTKGLDPAVPMKDSGVEWLGKVPAHWDVTKLGWALSELTYGFTNPMPTEDFGPAMLTANDIGWGAVLYDQARSTSESAFKEMLTDKSRPRAGDLLLTKDGTLGRVAVHDGRPACINQSVALIRPDVRVLDPEFLCSLLQASCYQTKMIFDAGGTTIKHIYITVLAKMNLAIPPLSEQQALLHFISGETGRFDVLTLEAEQVVSLLQERRSALISAAVTGKIDVRGWQPPASAPTPELVQEAV